MANEERIHTSVASHAGGVFLAMIRESEETLAGATALAHLAHHSQGLHNFSVDRLAPDDPRRTELVALGRRLSLLHKDFSDSLRGARTASLIRMVLQTSEGAAICTSVQPGDLIVGVTFAKSGEELLPGMPEVVSADSAVARLSTGLRARTRQPSYNPGGWETAGDEFSPFIGSVEPVASLRVPGARGAGRMEDALKEVLRRRELHFVAYHVDGQVAVAGDTFDAPELAPFFVQISAGVRRRFYSSFSRELSASVTSLNRTLTPMPGGRLLRLVLDVEQGAVYYYRLGAGRYLFGVTLDQSRVAHADLHMAELARLMAADE
ncbi:hypothetical protein SK854_34940 [Lentzea sp. BCCO 10_0061]|uniref:Roadblock/LAMTOR2 domain-containing protein n=1 Tax=Lentzea sokolovensis TaxID=3095429 RepID=A0ABU4V6D1_9PSEU|nr:hypothetical protein [Lentzea sp. BCCO 10_0061]MDX8147351.1 hypothetical protein [Lentzea sp. BCCO 10_0061]